jgi:hypothetical protein
LICLSIPASAMASASLINELLFKHFLKLI